MTKITMLFRQYHFRVRNTTIQAMIYIKQLKLANICSKNTVSSADASYYVYIDASGNLVFGINGAERAVARGLQINAWYKISCVYDGMTAQMDTKFRMAHY